MGLFNRLLALHGSNKPLEDFFTEIVAHLFATSHETLFAWLDSLNLACPAPYPDVHISTQASFERLHNQVFGSRFDMLVELTDGNNRDWIVIESKVGSVEGPRQLQRYAEMLAVQEGLRKRILIYITREFDPKDQHQILNGLTTVHFQQTRWHTFYAFLSKQHRTALTSEIIQFMEEQGMAQSTQFTAADILALSNLQKVYSLMNASLDDEVRGLLREVTGGVVKFTNPDQLKNNRRYFLWAWPSSDWWCGLGFSLPADGVQDYPSLTIQLEVASYAKPSPRQDLITAMQQIASNTRWSTYNLNATKSWAGIYQSRSLKQVLSQEDHVAAIKGIFLDLLNELYSIKRQFPHLPWATSQQGEGENQAPEEPME